MKQDELCNILTRRKYHQHCEFLLSQWLIQYNQFTQSWRMSMQLTRTNMLSRNMITITHNSMNIDNAQFYTPADSDEWKSCITKSECFDCDQKKHWDKNCSTNSYNKICQIITFNENSQLTSWKIYAALLAEFMVSQRSSASLCVVTSCIMFLNESENKSFWDQVAFQNTREKNLWCIYTFWALTRTIEIICLLIWLMKYDFEKNELKHELW